MDDHSGEEIEPEDEGEACEDIGEAEGEPSN